MDKTIKYIFVDLDGTLIKADLLFESVLKYTKKNPLKIFYLLFWLMRGKATLKHNLAQHIKFDVSALPYHTPLLDYLLAKKNQGHLLVLATASHMKYAKEIADYLNIFDGVIASDASTNMKGRQKLKSIKEYANGHAFSYAGDNKADVPIWRDAVSNIFVNAPKSAIEEAKSHGKEVKIFNKS